MSASESPTRSLGPPRTEEVSEGIYAYVQPDGSWWINNAGFLAGSMGVVSIDSASTLRRAEAYRAAIGQVCSGPVHTLINTHHHGDHTYGNCAFPGATIVAHRSCRSEMLAAGLPGARQALTWQSPDWGPLQLCPPFVTFSDTLDVWVDDLRCEARYIGTPAHTSNDSIVWVPDRSVLFAGDLVFNGGTPFILGGSLSGSIIAAQALKALQPAVIVPGHGDVCGPSALDDTLDYLHFLQSYAQSTHAAGLSPLDAARACDLAQFAELLDPERIVGNLYRAYSELEGNAPGAPVDRQAALADMVAFNGGQPLACLA